MIGRRRLLAAGLVAAAGTGLGIARFWSQWGRPEIVEDLLLSIEP